MSRDPAWPGCGIWSLGRGHLGSRGPWRGGAGWRSCGAPRPSGPHAQDGVWPSHGCHLGEQKHWPNAPFLHPEFPARTELLEAAKLGRGGGDCGMDSLICAFVACLFWTHCHAHTCVHTLAHAHLFSNISHSHTHMPTYTRILAHPGIGTHTCIFAHTHTQHHTYTLTHTPRTESRAGPCSTPPRPQPPRRCALTGGVSMQGRCEGTRGRAPVSASPRGCCCKGSGGPWGPQSALRTSRHRHTQGWGPGGGHGLPDARREAPPALGAEPRDQPQRGGFGGASPVSLAHLLLL